MITREQFEKLNVEIISREVIERGPIMDTVVCKYETIDGRIITHTFGMDGETFEVSKATRDAKS